MKRTPVRRKLPATTSLTTTPRAEISSCDPGSENDRSTSVRGMMNVPRGRFMVIPDGVMSSAWQSCTLRADRLLHGEHGGHPFRLSAIRGRCDADRSSWLHLKAPVRRAQKTRPFARSLEGLGLFDDEVRDVVDDGIGQLAGPALEGRLVVAQLERPLALRARQDVDELAVQRPCRLFTTGVRNARRA